MTPDNFRYAAHTYVDEWLACDRTARLVLGVEHTSLVDPAEACVELMNVAKRYSVVRNFKTEEGGARLSPVWTALIQLETPKSEVDAVCRVEELVAALKPTYHQELWSAASKFLWMRFGSPIVIYDTLTWNWICKHGECSSAGTYGDFYEAWRKLYAEHKKTIADGCAAMLEATSFFCPNDDMKEEFVEAVSSSWFSERVFDHAIVNQA